MNHSFACVYQPFENPVNDLVDLKTRIKAVPNNCWRMLQKVFVVVFEKVSILMVLIYKILYSKNKKTSYRHSVAFFSLSNAPDCSFPPIAVLLYKMFEIVNPSTDHPVFAPVPVLLCYFRYLEVHQPLTSLILPLVFQDRQLQPFLGLGGSLLFQYIPLANAGPNFTHVLCRSATVILIPFSLSINPPQIVVSLGFQYDVLYRVCVSVLILCLVGQLQLILPSSPGINSYGLPRFLDSSVPGLCLPMYTFVRHWSRISFDIRSFTAYPANGGQT